MPRRIPLENRSQGSGADRLSGLSQIFAASSEKQNGVTIEEGAEKLLNPPSWHPAVLGSHLLHEVGVGGLFS
jgi:hypothetical protein